MKPYQIYTDGGVINSNPSKLGGTWCYCWVDEKGERINQDLGVIEAGKDSLPERISNNLSELYAAMKALESIPISWNGTLFTDSRCTLLRITTSHAFKGIPLWMRMNISKIRAVRRYKVELLGGHPNRKELALGVRYDGKAVNKWNVWCDDQCRKLARRYLKEHSDG